MRKICVSLLILSLFALCLDGAKLHEFENRFGVPKIAVNGDHFYIFDARNFAVYIYSMTDFRLKKKIDVTHQTPSGASSLFDGSITDKHLMVHTRNKLSIYTLAGKTIDEKLFLPILSRVSMVGKNVVGYGIKRLQKEKLREFNIIFVNPEDNRVRMLNSVKKPLFTPGSKASGHTINLLDMTPQYATDGSRIVIGFPTVGFSFQIYNDSGKPIGRFHYKTPGKPVSKAFKEKVLKRLKGGRFYNARHRYVFPKNFPAFKSFIATKERIYVFPFYEERFKKQYDVWVFDYAGKRLKTSTIPDGIPAIYNKRYYYMIKNRTHDIWELHVRPI